MPGQTTPEGVPAFKLVLVGDGGTGANVNAAKAAFDFWTLAASLQLVNLCLA